MALRRPPLRDVHDERGAKFTEFGGWDMPVEFDSIVDEHRAVRESVGIFDVSHMGEIEVRGPDAAALVDRLTTNDAGALSAGRSQYAAITREDGVMLDDTIVYRLPPERREDGEDAYLFVPNAGNDVAAHDRWTAHRDEWGLDCTVVDATESYAMFAVQGPDSEDLLAGVAGESIRDVARFGVTTAEVAGVDLLAARTGYTGEDGFELVLPWADAERVWSALDCQPCGLGARDTLRIEQGFLLSGQDFDPEDEPRTPFEAGIGFAVALDTEFVGHDALAGATDPDERFVGLELVERGVPRHGYDIVDADGHVVGTVTSGTKPPTLPRAVGLGYVPVEYADPGTSLEVVIRGAKKAARVADPPFEPDP